MILSALAFGTQPDWHDVSVVGIDRITIEDVADASKGKLRYGILPIFQLMKREYCEEVLVRYLLVLIIRYTAVDGVDNAIIVDTDYLGALTLDRSRRRHVPDSKCNGRRFPSDD